MRSWIVCILCAVALFTLTGMMIGQQQGPIGSPGSTVARPRRPADADEKDTKKDEPAEQPKIPSQYKREKQQTPQATFSTDVDVVTLDVAVMDNKGHFIPGIPSGTFRVLEDGVPQQIKAVTAGEAPLTIAMVIEFSNRFQQIYGPAWFQTLQLVWGFASTLKPEDYVAIVAYDIRPEILSDFTTDRSKTQEALRRLTIPAFSEANLFDALCDTADRMSAIEGRKAIVLLSSGIDTFSKLRYDEARKKVQEAGVPVYGIGLMQMLREYMDARGYMGSIQRMDFLQADNQMRTFAKESGGQAYFPRFEGEYGQIFGAIHEALRNQYVLTYSPTNKAHDGTYRKIKVELVNPATNEALAVKDEKGKPVKYSIVTKSGYKAPRAVE
jgi:Ca-activated chloride channel family protein